MELLHKIIMCEHIPGVRRLTTRSQIIRAVELVAKYADAYEDED